MTCLQVLREAGRADRAVTLADQKLRRAPATILRQILRDELPERSNIARLTVELIRIDARHHTAVAGVDGIDEHEIGGLEQRVLIVDKAVRRRRLRAIVPHSNAARAEGTEMEIH